MVRVVGKSETQPTTKKKKDAEEEAKSNFYVGLQTDEATRSHHHQTCQEIWYRILHPYIAGVQEIHFRIYWVSWLFPFGIYRFRSWQELFFSNPAEFCTSTT